MFFHLKPHLLNKKPLKTTQGGRFLAVFVLFITLFLNNFAVAETSKAAFLEDVFAESAVEKKIWLLGEHKKVVSAILNHPYKQLRVGYWSAKEKPDTRVWFLQEIGKEKEIDVGIVIYNNRIQKLRILAFRESRGWEVKLPFFTKQFEQNKLTVEYTLANQVSNISGATLSWRAVTKLARVALYLNKQLP